MTPEQFFKTYANLPINQRKVLLYPIYFGEMTFETLYDKIHAKEEEIRELKKKQQDLIDLAEEYL